MCPWLAGAVVDRALKAGAGAISPADWICPRDNQPSASDQPGARRRAPRHDAGMDPRAPRRAARAPRRAPRARTPRRKLSAIIEGLSAMRNQLNSVQNISDRRSQRGRNVADQEMPTCGDHVSPADHHVAHVRSGRREDHCLEDGQVRRSGGASPGA